MSNVHELRTFGRLPDVERATGLKRSYIYKAVQDGAFPRPIKIASRAVVWDMAEVAAWQAERIAERDMESAT